jgi:outer membrane protein assembly factor BamE
MRRPRPHRSVQALPALLPATLLLLAGCESLQNTDSLFGVITPYRIDIVQGNVVTKEMLAQLRPGMSRSQVRDVLGTPLLTDPFHAARWDYIFSIRRPGAEAQRRSVVVRFEGDIMGAVEAGELPSEREFVAAITSAKTEEVPRLELSDDERKALPQPARAEAPTSAPEPSGPVRDYPPLEAS